MIALAQQQQALLAALWQPSILVATEFIANNVQLARPGAQNITERGLMAYRSNASELAQRVLAAAYPVLVQLLEEDNFGHLARGFWRQCPPLRGDMAQWGGELAAHIETLAQLTDEPYLPDVARAEWALHQLATAADAPQDAGSFALLSERDPAQFTLLLAPAQCIASSHPVASIITAHLEGQPPLEEAGRLLREGAAQTALAWRQGLRPRLRCTLPGEVKFIAALQGRASLADSLARAEELDFNQWLAAAAQSGLLLAAAPLLT
ncbi:MAG: DNA-binding domain-containing protein [Ramlibacter sp.]